MNCLENESIMLYILNYNCNENANYLYNELTNTVKRM